MAEDLETLLARHHDGDLDEAGLRELVERLAGDQTARARFRRELLLTVALRQEALLQSLAPARRRWWRWAAMTAGGLAAALLVALLLHPSADPIRPRFDGAAVAIGDELHGPGELRWPDGSTAVLAGDAALRLTAGDERAALLRGGLAVQVSHQAPGSSFVIAAGPLFLRAIGTRFDVRVGDDGIAVQVAEGVVAIEESRESVPAELLFAGDAWRRDRGTAAARVTVDEAARNAARAAGRVDGELIADYRFDEGAGGTVRDRTGGGRDLAIAPGTCAWTPAGLAVSGRKALHWQGDGSAFREALEREGLSIEIAWDGAPSPNAVGDLLELRSGPGDDDSFLIGAKPTDTIHHIVVRSGRDGVQVFTEGRQIVRFPMGSTLATRFSNIVRSGRLEFTIQGLAHPYVDKRTLSGDRAWQATFRRVTIHGRPLSAEEIRRNALADEAERQRRR